MSTEQTPLEQRVNIAHLAYWTHKEGCWYTGNPADPTGRGCAEHNKLHDAWTEAVQQLGASTVADRVEEWLDYQVKIAGENTTPAVLLDLADEQTTFPILHASELRKLIAENRSLRAENSTMRVSLNAAIKILRPVWDALLANLVPIWKMIEPILETDTEREYLVYMPSNRDRSSCTVCGAVITYIEGISPASSGWDHVDELIDIAHKAQFGGTL